MRAAYTRGGESPGCAPAVATVVMSLPVFGATSIASAQRSGSMFQPVNNTSHCGFDVLCKFESRPTRASPLYWRKPSRGRICICTSCFTFDSRFWCFGLWLINRKNQKHRKYAKNTFRRFIHVLNQAGSPGGTAASALAWPTHNNSSHFFEH